MTPNEFTKDLDKRPPEEVRKLYKALFKDKEETRVKTHDDVDHPAHYGSADDPYEVIKVLEAKMTAEELRGFLKGNIHRYLFRANGKGSHDKDCEKAAWYANYLEGVNQRTSEARVQARAEVDLSKIEEAIRREEPIVRYGLNITKAAADVLSERGRHLELGYTHEHDDALRHNRLVNLIRSTLGANAGYEPSRKELVAAGALILAEIERLDRAEARQKQSAGAL